MPFKPPLTYADLRAMRIRHTRADGTVDPDMLAALWEIKRQHSEVLRLHQVSSALTPPSGILRVVFDDLMANNAAEPCVLEYEQMLAELLDAPPKPRKGLENR